MRKELLVGLVYILRNFSWFLSTGAIQTVLKGRHRKMAPSLHDAVGGYGSAGAARAQTLSYNKNRNSSFIFLIKCNCWKYLERPKFMPQAQRKDCSFSLPMNISTFANCQTLSESFKCNSSEGKLRNYKKIHTATHKIYSMLWISEPMSLPACLSIADVPLRQPDTVASVQHRSRWCNALWDVVTIHLSLPLTLMFPTLAIAPSAWQRPYRKCSQVDSEPSPCNIKSPWQRPFISFASPACIIGWCQIWSTFAPPHPCTSSLPPFLQQRALALRLVYTDINASYFFMQDVNEKRKCLC